MHQPKWNNTEEFKTYLLNAAQVLSMSTMAFGVPAVIGIEEYGRFAALFALPGTLTVFAQGLYISRVGKCDYNEFRVGACFFNFILTGLAFLVSSFFCGIATGGMVAFIFAVLLERFRWEALTLMCANGQYKKALRDSEVLTFLITVTGLTMAQHFHYRSHILPIVLLGGSMLISTYKLASVNPARMPRTSDLYSCMKSVTSGGFSGVFVRLHEELFIVQMPYTLSLVLGHRQAGVFRLTVSVVKLFFKAFPYRYETVLSDFVEGPPNTDKILRYFLIVNVLSIGSAAFIGVLRAAFPASNTLNSIDVWILSSAGFLAMASIYSPLLVLHHPRYYLVIIAAFALTLLLLLCYGYFWFQVSFLLMQLTIFFAIFRFLQGRIMRQGAFNP